MNPANTGEAFAHTDAEPATHTEEPQGTANGHDEDLDAVPSIFQMPAIIDRLTAAYANANAERRKTFMIVPGRYGSALAFRAKPIPYEQFRKEAERAAKRGVDSAEAETAFAAKVIVGSCEAIMVADGVGGDLRPAEEVVREFASSGPVLFDSRLCQMLGISPVPDSEYAIARLVYNNKQAMQTTLRELLAFFSEETAGDDEDVERPT